MVLKIVLGISLCCLGLILLKGFHRKLDYLYCMNYYYASSLQTELDITGYNSPTYHGQAVRCMKDQGYVDTSLPTVHVKNFTDRTSSSARVVCEITYPGSAEVTERGFVWSINADFSTSTRVPCGSGAGEYAMTITLLLHTRDQERTLVLLELLTVT